MSTPKAVKQSSITATGNVITVPVKSIVVDHTRNLRFKPPTAKDIADTKQSILTEGLHQSVVVRRLTDEEITQYGGHVEYMLVAGYRRCQCIIDLEAEGKHTGMILAHVEQYEDLGQERATNFDENDKRRDLSPMDTAKAIIVMRADGLNDVQISEKLNKSKSYVGQMGRLMSLRPAIQERIHAGKDSPKYIPWTTARELALMSEEEQDKELAEIDAGEAGEKAQDRLRKKKAAKEDNKTGKLISAKKAMGIIAERVNEIKTAAKDAEKDLTKKEEALLGVYDLLRKFLKGSLGGQAFTKKLEEAV